MNSKPFAIYLQSIARGAKNHTEMDWNPPKMKIPGVRKYLCLLPMKARLFALLLCFMHLLTGKEAHAQQLFFSTLSSKDGLPSNIISGIAQDKDDFIWIGTGNGLARYDGTRFKTFKKTESANSLPSNEISCLISDGHYIYVGTWNGLCRINTVTFKVNRVELGGSKAVRVLYKGGHDILWIGTEDGLIQYDISKDEIVEVFNTRKNGLSHNTIRSIYEDPSGTLWVGTYDKLNRLAAGRPDFKVYDLKGAYRPSLKNNLICGEIRPVRNSSDSLLWVGTETGLCLFNTYTGAYRHFGETNAGFSNEVIKCMYLDDGDNIWLGTDFGMSIFDPLDQKSKSYFHNPKIPYSIANNAIWQIYEDRGGVIWFVTSNGLSRMNKHQSFYAYHEVTNQIDNQLVGNQVRSSLITAKGIIWLATLHGIIRIDPKTNERQVFDTNAGNRKILLNNAYALEEDELGRIWIGTAGGINIWDENRQKMEAITANASNGLVTNYIAKFIKGGDGSLWVSAYQGGLFKISGADDDLSDIHFTTVAGQFGSEKAVSGNQAIWYSIYNELFRVDQSTLKQSPIIAFNNLTNRRDIHCLYFSKDSRLWAGTQNGLLSYDPEKELANFHPIVTGNDVNIGNISEDASGNIIGVASNFIFKFNPLTDSTEVFPLDKDLPIKTFYYGCSARSTAGTIVVGGDNGFISFHPDDLKPDHYKPKIFITALEINNNLVNNGDEVDGKVLLENDISFTKDLTLENTHRSSITFEFSALHFWQPSINVYAYKLEGFDNDWTYVSGTRNFAVYSNLSPGEYVFRVRGTNSFGVWSDQEASANITIKPSLFLSNGFILLYACLLLAIAFISLRIYSGRLHLRNELKIAKLEKEHTEELGKIRQEFFTNISHELRTPISLILPPIHQMMKRGNLDQENLRLITLAEKNSHRLLRLINQVLDFRKLETNKLEAKPSPVDLVQFCQNIQLLFSDKASRKNITYTFVSSAGELEVWIDPEKIETVLFNLLSNAFKFTPKGGEIIIAISQLVATQKYPGGAAGIKVSDSGIGIGPDDQQKIFEPFYQTREARKMEVGTGIGLALALEYVKLHGGDIFLESQRGHGSTFTVLLPMGNTHFPADAIQDNHNTEIIATQKAVETTLPSSNGHDMRTYKPLILLIDDSTDIIDFVRISLSEKYDFIVAENGEEGLKKALSYLPEVIISDIMMPVMDGLTLCKRIKENPKTSHIAIILLTAKDQSNYKIEGVKTGADVYITKPFEIEFLEANVDHLIIRKKELSDYLRNELILQPAVENNGKNVDDMFVKKVVQIIEANISNPDFSVETLSDEIGMSSTHLYRKLKSLTKLSANEIIKKYRLKKASILLKNKEGNISQIMYEVGFSNLSYFSKCFKSEFAMSPKDFQQKVGTSQFDVAGKFGIEAEREE
jgi:signal transduction histidine kinase/ligand-binding sensor domain-containing protein/DNA-binding response OmpR family regulator